MRRLWWLSALVAIAGCGSGGIRGGIEDILNPAPPPSAGPRAVEEVLETAVEATHVSTIALAALDGTGSCAALVSGCLSTGCDFELEVDVAGCPVPISGGGGSGVVVVSGTRTGPDSAMLFANFANLELTLEGDWFVAEIASMIAERSGDRVTVVYAQQNVTLRTGSTAASAELSQHVWTSVADLGGTPAETSDDHYSISGGVQETEAGTQGVYLTQAALAGAEIGPDCRRNPSAGSAVVERVGAGSSVVLSMLHLGFHPECDGRADIVSAFGTDMFSIGGTVHMDLVD